MLIIDYIKKIKAKDNEIKERLNLSAENSLVAFRGESQKYDTPMRPSLYRNGYDLNYLLELLESHQIVEYGTSKVNKMIESQHNIEISVLLDITYNVLSALYFACSGYPNKMGMVYIIRAPMEFVSTKNEIEIEMEFKLENPKMSDANKMKYNGYRDSFAILKEMKVNERIKAQSGGFIYFYDAKDPQIPNYYYEGVEIIPSDKEEILKELDEYFAINRSSIYPEKSYQKENIIKQLENQPGNFVGNHDDFLEKMKTNQFIDFRMNVRIMLGELFKIEKVDYQGDELRFNDLFKLKRYYFEKIKLLDSKKDSSIMKKLDSILMEEKRKFKRGRDE